MFWLVRLSMIYLSYIVVLEGVLRYHNFTRFFAPMGGDMNSLDIYLIKSENSDNSGIDKEAFDQSLRNMGVDLASAGGKVLRNFKDNPLVSSAVLGAGIGGAQQAYTAKKDQGESRVKKGLKGALYGGLGGAAAGAAFSGAARNIGRYGEDIVGHAEKLRGPGGLKNVESGQFRELMRDTVLNRESRRGGKALASVRKAFDDAKERAKSTGSDVDVKKYKAAKKALDDAGGGLGTQYGPAAAAAIIGTGAIGGVYGVPAAKRAYDNYQQDKTSSVRLMAILEKEANFGALAAKAVGGIAQGAGKAIQMGAANPALAGAAVGATTGAITAGEGNRLKGALGGAALGAGAGAGMAKLAPQATANMGQLGKALQGQGKKVIRKAGEEGATFAGSMKGVGTKLKTDMANFTGANRKLALPSAGGDRAAMGMSGTAAAGTALAGTAGAGILAGSIMRGQKKPTQQQQQNQQNIQNRFRGVAANFG